MTAPLIATPILDTARIRQGDAQATAEAFESISAMLAQLAKSSAARVGRWRDALLTPDNFHEPSGGFWTVIADNILRARYLIVDDLMIFSLHLEGTFITNPFVFLLEVDIPSGYVLAGDVGSEQLETWSWSSPGVPLIFETGQAIGSAGGRTLTLIRADGVVVGPATYFPAARIDLGFTVALEVTKG